MDFETLKKDNRKKWIVGAIAILAITSVVFFVSTRANYKTTQRLNLINKTVNYSISDLNVMAIKVQNSSGGYDTANTVPTSGYTLSSESYCEVNGSKDTSIPIEYKDGKATIGVNKRGTKCYLYFDALNASKFFLGKNEMIHETFTSDSGETVDTGYRYEGANPNNYVTFNNELWRIIGVFDVETSTGKTEQLVKLIRNESIGNIKWDTYGTYGSNDWTQSDIKTILNGQYYNGENINYTYKNSIHGTVSITGKSLNDISRSMIENVKWNLGATESSITASEMYTNEREAKGYGSNPIVWNGYVGLMYPSDYGYAVDSASCARTTTLNSYSSCKTNNWLYNSASQWNITPWASTSNYGLYVNSAGYFDYGNGNSVTGRYGVRPSLYLKSNVSIVDNGKDGSSTNPYDLVLN